MNKKQVQNYRTRMNKDLSSLSCMGGMMLQLEIDNMPLETKIALREALLNSKKPLTYPYLEKAIAKATSQQVGAE